MLLVPPMPDLAMQRPPIDPELMGLVYDELRGIARRIVRGEHDERSLGATGLVHEAMGRLLASEGYKPGATPATVLALTTRVMGHVLIDRARARRCLKRGGLRRRLPLDHILDAIEPLGGDFEDLHEAIERLNARHERLGRLVLLRYLVGLTNEEIAQAEGVGVRAIEASLRAARAWLHRDLLNGEERAGAV
ncbi:ECF-type sigma factor [Aquisphaera insulae]|uniref:ECF-type sigma factor n=1 Tax=Aquisphaera insulae TaxID=2712864 RepID=UPI0013ED8E2B|nr:ECF-type sigma factor [Aquisphaera insulae]